MDFADSDLYKTVEAIAWESGRIGQIVAAEFLSGAIDLIERTQSPDGYLNTRVQGDPALKRWESLLWSHELYCAGHLFQAAVAVRRVLGQDRLLGVARRFADRIVADLSGRDDALDGHAEVETALVELYRETGDERYLDFARAQIEHRGHGRLPADPLGREYFGDHAPIRQISEAVGHVVRQVYYVAGAVDVFLETGERAYLEAADRVWRDAYSTKTYLTGGQGSRHHGEAFGDPYELPPDRAYAETCAGIGSFLWNWRMLLATGQARFADQMETVLYNAIGASVSFDGRHFFYTNPLQVRTGHRAATENSPVTRLSWYECACCPPNLSRLLSSLQNYLATATTDGLQLHLLTPAQLRAEIGGVQLAVTVTTDYPWDGSVRIDIDGSGLCELAIRIPAWAGGFEARLDGTPIAATAGDGYLRITRNWDGSHQLALDLRLKTSVVTAHPRVDAVRGCVALQRGPLVYCIETTENPGAALEDIQIEPDSFQPASGAGFGVRTVLSGAGWICRNDSTSLYTATDCQPPTPTPITVTAIPYHAWGNRGPTAMRVWIPQYAGLGMGTRP